MLKFFTDVFQFTGKRQKFFGQGSVVGFFGLLALGVLNISCSEASFDANPAGAQRFKVYAFNPATSQGSFVSVMLENLATVQDLSGRYVQFLYAPFENNNDLQGSSPKLSFQQNREGVWIPQTSLSVEAASLYYHFQSLYYFDQKIGFENSYELPRRIALRSRVVTRHAKKMEQNNAFYDMKRKVFFFVPTEGERLQIPMNPGIIAHEHFHSLFHRLVLNQMRLADSAQAFIGAHDSIGQREGNKEDPKVKKEESEGNALEESELLSRHYFVVLRAMNEGLADYWGWLYSGDYEFVGRSVPGAINTRKLGVPSVVPRLSSALLLELLKSFSKSSVRESLAAYSYEIGTQLARQFVLLDTKISSLKEISEKNASEAHKEKMAKALLLYLQNFGRQIQDKKEKKEIIDLQEFFQDYLVFLEKSDATYFSESIKKSGFLESKDEVP